MKKCPFCAEEIQDEAIKCKHCGSVQNSTPDQETTLWKGRQNLQMLGCMFLVGIILIPLWGLGLLIILSVLYGWYRTEYEVTTRRLIAKHGFLYRRLHSVRIMDIRSIELHKPFMVFGQGTGTLFFHTAASGNASIVFHSVKNASKLKDLVEDAQQRLGS